MMARKRTWAVLATLTLITAMAVSAGTKAVGSDWRTASRASAGIAPDPAATQDAVIQIYAARAFSWRGAFAVHPWISVKPRNADHYTVYQIVGWRARRGMSALVVHQDLPDRHWFDAKPELLVDIQGPHAEDLIRKIDDAARRYPFADEYTLFPGPNSNTFVAWIGRQVPELRLDLPPTAIGKDYLDEGKIVDTAISGTGYQFSLAGLLGVTLAREEGLEINLAGLAFGVDPGDLSLRLPLLGNPGS